MFFTDDPVGGDVYVQSIEIIIVECVPQGFMTGCDYDGAMRD